MSTKSIPLAILADGMGGHRAGDVASRQAVSGLGTAWEKTELTDSEKAAQWLIQKSRQKVSRSMKRHRG